MKIEWLRILDAIVTSASMKEAALRLHKTQPALTIAVKKLESELGFEVLDRSAYRVKLTEHGKVYYREVKQLLSGATQLDVLARELALGNEASFRICYEQICYRAQYNKIIQDAFGQFASTEFSLLSGRRFFSLEQVNSGAADFGIGPWFDLFHSTGDLDSIPIGQLTIGLVASPDLATKTDFTYRELQKLPCVAMFESGFSFDSERLSFADTANVMKIDDINTYKSFLLSGAGWGLAGLQYVRDELEAGTLKRIRVTDREDEFGCEIRAFRKYSRHYGPVSRHIWAQFKALSEQTPRSRFSCPNINQ